MATALEGYTETVVISFIDLYPKEGDTIHDVPQQSWIDRQTSLFQEAR